MRKHIIGIDLGTSNTLIWVDTSDGIIFNEPSILAWKKESHQVVEIGYLAYKILGKVPQDMELKHPSKNGVIADVEVATAYLESAFKNLKIKKLLRKSTIIFSSPSDITPVERQAFIDVAKNLGVSNVHIEDQARLAALGSGVDFYSTRGNMIVNIGGAKTNIACVALGNNVITKSTQYGGDSVNEAIIRHVRTKHHLIIGEKTAEYIKMKIGTLLENPDNNLLEVSGKDTISGIPNSVVISTVEIKDVIKKIYDEIANVILDTLEITPPEISSDIIHTGITLTGGGCLLNGARDYFQKALSVNAHITPTPLESTIQGIKLIASEIVKEDSKK